jgi:ssDNA-binding replication factor A large subunit
MIEGNNVLKVRVANKGNINKHAKGKLFKVDLVDDFDDNPSNNMIESCFYTEETDLFYEEIQFGKTYLISGIEVKDANKKFTCVQHDYRIIISKDTTFQLVAASQAKTT